MTGNNRMAAAALLASMLSALSLVPVISGGQWLSNAFVGLSLVALTGAGCRRARVVDSLIPFAQLLVLVAFLTAKFAAHDAVFGVVPGPAALETVGHVGRSGLDDIARFAAPVPPT